MSRVAAIIPARNEALTVADSVVAARGCRFVDEVIVVDDGSGDLTALRAEEAGARVLVLEGSGGSKARAMQAGVDATDAEFLLFVDADLTGLEPRHLDAVCEPVLDARAELSVGAFDYGPILNPMVLRWPPLSGERIVPRWVWEAIPDAKLDGYTIEVRVNEVICEGRHRTVARTMDGVFHRTKRDKFGRLEGIRRTWHMYRALLGMLRPIGDVRWRTYVFYLRGLTVEP